MLAQELLDIRVALRRRGIIVAYCGFATETVLSGLGEALKQKLTIEDAGTKTMRSVFAVFVEQMQNIIRSSEERLPSDAGCCRRSSGSSRTISRRGPTTTPWTRSAR